MKSTRVMRSLILASAVAVAAGALWADDAPAKPKRHISPGQQRRIADPGNQ